MAVADDQSPLLTPCCSFKLLTPAGALLFDPVRVILKLPVRPNKRGQVLKQNTGPYPGGQSSCFVARVSA
jgi:hypothetical protein